MKVLTKEQEAAHYREVVKGGIIGGVLGVSVGLAGLLAAQRRYAGIRNLTLPFKSFLVTSAGSFGLIINADRWSSAYQRRTNPMYGYTPQAAIEAEALAASKSTTDRMLDWGRENRYKIVFGSWIASMAAAGAIVNRSKYMTAAQKLVQARVYAQGLTVAVLLVTAAFEMSDAKTGSGRWQTVMVLDPKDPEHKRMIEKKIHKEEYEGQDLWKDMVEAEEMRIAERKKQREAEESAKAKQSTA